MSSQAHAQWRPTTGLAMAAGRGKKALVAAADLPRAATRRLNRCHRRPAAACKCAAFSSASESADKHAEIFAEGAAIAPTPIPRAEALRRMEHAIAAKPTLVEFLAALDEVTALSGFPRPDAYGSVACGDTPRQWAWPQLLAALKAVNGAEVADLVRLTGQNGSPPPPSASTRSEGDGMVRRRRGRGHDGHGVDLRRGRAIPG